MPCSFHIISPFLYVYSSLIMFTSDIKIRLALEILTHDTNQCRTLLTRRDGPRAHALRPLVKISDDFFFAIGSTERRRNQVLNSAWPVQQPIEELSNATLSYEYCCRSDVVVRCYCLQYFFFPHALYRLCTRARVMSS